MPIDPRSAFESWLDVKVHKKQKKNDGVVVFSLLFGPYRKPGTIALSRMRWQVS